MKFNGLFLLTLLVLAFCFVKTESVDFEANLTGAAMAPAVQTEATGTSDIEFNPDDNDLSWDIEIDGIEESDIIAAHIHGPAPEGQNAGVLITLKNQTDEIKGSATLDQEQVAYLFQGLLYIVVHSNAHPDGEIRGQIRTLATRFIADLNGAQEVPPVESPFSGHASVDFDYSSREMEVTLEHDAEDVTVMHIHGPAGFGTNAAVLFQFNSTEGDATEKFTLTETEMNYLRDGLIYINVHTLSHPDGEIRGQFVVDLDDPNGNDGTIAAAAVSVVLGVIILTALAMIIILGVTYYYKRQQIHEYIRNRRFDSNKGESLLSDSDEY